MLDKATTAILYRLAVAKAARVIEAARLPPTPRARSKLAKQLVLIYIALPAVESLHPKTTTKALNSQLSALQKQLQSVSAALDKSPELRNILTAAERDIAACNATPSGYGSNVSELKQTIQTATKLLKHIFDQQRRFKELSEEKRFQLLMAYGHKFCNERQQLFAFFKESKHQKMAGAIVELIAGMYDEVFARNFGVGVKRTGEDAGQFDSPGIRFACAVVEVLDLVRHFGGNRHTLPRKIGNLWQSNAEIRNPELRALNRITFSHDFFSSKPRPKRELV